MVIDVAELELMVRANHKLSAEDRARIRRLKSIRLNLHGTHKQIEFAKALGVSQRRYNNWEMGFPLTADAASKIKAITPEIDLDYILEGDLRGLTAEVLRRLRKSEEN